MAAAVLIPSLVCALAIFLLAYARRTWRRKKRDRKAPSIGFLHPHALSGGGGERVLWCAVLSTRDAFPDSRIVIYSAWNDAGLSLENAVSVSRNKVREQFGLDVSNVDFLPVDLPCATLVEAARYPRLTLLRQAIGTIRLGAYAFSKQQVDVFIDTANLTFALVWPQVLGAITVSYVHYPTISSDMLTVVRNRKAQFNNSTAITSSTRLSYLKLAYYRLFAILYAICGQFVDIAFANSSWTRGHLEHIWWNGAGIETMFPPCPIRNVPTGQREEGVIVSVGQFRPEKDHMLQLDILEGVLSRRPDCARLIMIGGTRNAADRARAAELAECAKERKLPVVVAVDVSRAELDRMLGCASVGLHTMRDEHFGISVVELQACGLVVIAHRSGGVQMDIVKDKVTGFLACDKEEYIERVLRAMQGGREVEIVRGKGIEAAQRFSEKEFLRGFGVVLKKKMT